MEVYVSAYEVTDRGNMPPVAWEQISPIEHPPTSTFFGLPSLIERRFHCRQ